MFWSDWGETPRISRAGMDGSNKTNIVDTSITWPNGLTLDYQENRVYWIDARYNHIASVDYHGNSRRMTYKQAVNHPYALTMFGKQLYWTDWDTNSIRNCRILNNNVTYNVNVIKTNIYYPMDIKVYEAQRQPNGKLSAERIFPVIQYINNVSLTKYYHCSLQNTLNWVNIGDQFFEKVQKIILPTFPQCTSIFPKTHYEFS